MGSCSWQVCGAGNWILISQLEFEGKTKGEKGSTFLHPSPFDKCQDVCGTRPNLFSQHCMGWVKGRSWLDALLSGQFGIAVL